MGPHWRDYRLRELAIFAGCKVDLSRDNASSTLQEMAHQAGCSMDAPTASPIFTRRHRICFRDNIAPEGRPGILVVHGICDPELPQVSRHFEGLRRIERIAGRAGVDFWLLHAADIRRNAPGLVYLLLYRGSYIRCLRMLCVTLSWFSLNWNIARMR